MRSNNIYGYLIVLRGMNCAYKIISFHYFGHWIITKFSFRKIHSIWDYDRQSDDVTGIHANHRNQLQLNTSSREIFIFCWKFPNEIMESKISSQFLKEFFFEVSSRNRPKTPPGILFFLFEKFQQKNKYLSGYAHVFQPSFRIQ